MADAPSAANGSVAHSVSQGIATITFGHPKSNSLPGAILRRLASTFETVGSDAGVAVVLLQSLGSGAFCAGASFDELQAIRTEAEGTEFFSGFAHLILAMRRCPKLVVTRVQGKAAGGGVGIIAASDYVIAVPGASLRLSELAIGIGPFVVGPVIERRVGRGPYAALSVDAEWRDAQWGERHGLYARLVDTPSALDSVIPAFLGRLATFNPEATTQLKRVMWEGTKGWETLLFERAAMSGRLVLSAHTRQAIAAFGTRS